MVGSPKKRARRLAHEAEQKKIAGVALPTRPQAKHEDVPAPDPIIDWIEGGTVPPLQPETETDPFVGALSKAKEQAYNELLGLSLDRALDIMRIKPGDENFTPQVLTRQASIISSVLSTTARIDEQRLRGRGRDRFDEIMKAIKAERAKG